MQLVIVWLESWNNDCWIWLKVNGKLIWTAGQFCLIRFYPTDFWIVLRKYDNFKMQIQNKEYFHVYYCCLGPIKFTMHYVPWNRCNLMSIYWQLWIFLLSLACVLLTCDWAIPSVFVLKDNNRDLSISSPNASQSNDINNILGIFVFISESRFGQRLIVIGLADN